MPTVVRRIRWSRPIARVPSIPTGAPDAAAWGMMTGALGSIPTLEDLDVSGVPPNPTVVACFFHRPTHGVSVAMVGSLFGFTHPILYRSPFMVEGLRFIMDKYVTTINM